MTDDAVPPSPPATAPTSEVDAAATQPDTVYPAASEGPPPAAVTEPTSSLEPAAIVASAEVPHTLAPTDAPFPTFVHAFGWLAATGLSVGMALATLTQWPKLPNWVLHNNLPQPTRMAILATMGVGMLAFVVPAFAWLALRGKTGLSSVHRVAMRLSPFTIVGLLPVLFHNDAWVGFEMVFAMCVAALSLLGYFTFKQSFEQAPILPERFQRGFSSLKARFGSPQLPTILAIAAMVFYGLWFSAFSLAAHYELLTSSFDLGIENNLIWQASHLHAPLFRSTPLGGGMTHLGLHQTYFSYLLAIPYRLFPDARFLLIMQAWVLGGASLVLYQLSRQRIGDWAAAALAWVYVLYSPLHGANLYDFHYQPLSIIFLFAIVYCVERGWLKRAALCVLLTLSLREDMGLLVAVICAWLALSNKRPAMMIAFIGASLFHFVLLKLIIMPIFLGGASAYINQYSGMLAEGDNGFGGVLKTLLANPGYSMNWLLEPGKQLYVLQVMGPLVFLPVMRKSNLTLLLPGFFFTLLSTRYPALMMISFQYSAYWIPFVMLAVVSALQWLRGKEPAVFKAAVCTLLLASVLHSRQFGAILRTENVHAHFSGAYHLVPTPEEHKRHDDYVALTSQIGENDKVAAAELLLPALSSRDYIYTLRMGVVDADWIIASTPVRGDELGPLRQALQGEYGVVEVRPPFVLAKRGFPKDKNPAGQAVLGF